VCSLCPWPKCEHIERSTDLFFPSKLNFCNLFQFPTTNIHSKINIFHTLALEIVKLNSIKSDSPRANFCQHQECFQTPIQFSVLISFSFHWENGSIIKSFHTIAPTLSSRKGFMKIPRAPRGLEISAWQNETKQNKGACHIVALPFTFLKKWKLNYISPCKNILIFKKSSKRNQKILQDITTL
jgi:hypothetical protein